MTRATYRQYTGAAPGGYPRRPCEVCGEEVAHTSAGKPIKAHRLGRAHQAEVARMRREREAASGR